MMEEYFNTLLQETERRMAAAAAGMEGKETVATCRDGFVPESQEP